MHSAQVRVLDLACVRSGRWHVNWAVPSGDKGRALLVRRFSPLGHESRSGTGATTEEAQVWQAVRAQLRSLDSARSSSLAAYEKLLKAHADAKNIDALYDATEHAVHEEQK